jgi:formylglycine-generating enzyme required for sulfatase activity
MAIVGSFPKGASPFGVMDLVGSVYQWCADTYHSNFYRSMSRENPFNPPKEHNARVLRGSRWSDGDRNDFRVSLRMGRSPNDRNEYFGFRCARSEPLGLLPTSGGR